MGNTSKNRDSYLDSLKGIAILGVTLVHTGARILPGILGKIGYAGSHGVQMFFVISAFLSFRSCERWFENPANVHLKTVYGWYLRKLIRLVPLYYFCLFLSMLTGPGYATAWLGNEDHVTIFNILAHIFLVHAFFPHYCNSILAVEWYLGVLIVYILLTPLFYRYIKSFGLCLLFVVVMYFLKPLMIQGLSALLPTDNDPTIYNNYIYSLNPIARIQVYQIGILVFFIIRKGFNLLSENRMLAAYSLLLFTLMMLFGEILGENKLWRIDSFTMYGIWCALLVISQAVCASPVIDNPFFRLFGKYSYGIYLFQYIWIPFYDRHSRLFIMFSHNILSEDGKYDILIKFVVSVIVLLFISIVSAKCVEEPLKKRLCKHLKGKLDLKTNR